MSNAQWKMPRPRIGDPVLFSTDIHGFSNPVLGYVIKEPGDSTVYILTFTHTGWVERPSVHHKDDPAISGDNGWSDLGVWEFSPLALEIRKLVATANAKERLSVSSK